MPKAVAQPKTRETKRKTITKAEIARRLVDLDVAQTSALRDLEMDVNGDRGIPSKSVLADARRVIP